MLGKPVRPALLPQVLSEGSHEIDLQVADLPRIVHFYF
jgi:hypothetical protein